MDNSNMDSISKNSQPGGNMAKAVAVLEIINGVILAFFAMYGLVMKPDPGYLLPSLLMLLIGSLFIAAGIFIFKLNKGAWFASVVFYGGGTIYLTAYTLIEHFAHGVVMAIAFHPGIVFLGIISVLLVLARKAVFSGK